MSTQTLLQKIRGDHEPHRSNPERCDACTLLELVDKQRDAMQGVIEGFSKNQVDPVGMSKRLQDGLGR